MNKNIYDASSIEVIESLEAVRKRPGMYIGNTDSNGLHHLIKEIIDNSLDEHLAGYANNIIVTLNSDNSVEIEDDGRGIPVDIHPKTKRPTVETVFTTLHAGGKFGGENSGYKISGGLHGVGASVVNALAEYLNVIVWKGKKKYRIEFKNGGKLNHELKGSLNSSGKNHGTKIIFKPDNTIFSSINFNANKISEWLEQIAYLNANLKIVFIDNKNEKETIFHFPEGIKLYVDHLAKKNKELSPSTFFEAKSPEISFQLAFKYTSSDQEEILSFANNINTEDGGSHESAFRSALGRAFNNFIEENNLKSQGLTLDGSDIREGIFAVISVYIVEKHLQFEGQTKTKLSSNEVKKFVDKKVYDEISYYLHQNRNYGQLIIKKAYESRRAKEAAKKAREIDKKINKKTIQNTISKLIPAQSKKSYERELFIVEGDSAGGSAKLGRDNKTQAILPLKGKIVNTEKATLKNIVENDELSSIIYSIGGGLGNRFSLQKTNYGKIIIMTDADTDGAHIQVLLLTFFYRFMRELIEDGRIFIALPPLFKFKNLKTKKEAYAWTQEELEQLRKNVSNYEIQRYKGLGEMNYQQLWETTMDKSTRSLVQVKISDFNLADKRIETLMGKNVEARRKWIENHVEFSLEEEEKII